MSPQTSRTPSIVLRTFIKCVSVLKKNSQKFGLLDRQKKSAFKAVSTIPVSDVIS